MRHKLRLLSVAVSISLVLIMGFGKKEAVAADTALTAADATAIAKEAYTYGFPMVMGYKLIYNYAVDKANPEYKGQFNNLSCEARLFTPQDKAIVTPNADTPYCMFWMDVRTEPLVLTVPEMEPERYYSFQLIDLYTHNFAYVGTLTTGNRAGKFLIAGPDWNGEKPHGITDVIQSETNFIFNITRTQLFGPDDLGKVKDIQSSYGLQTLSAFLGTKAPHPKPLPEFPEWIEGSQFDERSFGYLDFIMALLKAPVEREKRLWNRIARIGLGLENTFDFTALTAQTQDALKKGIKEAFGEMEQFLVDNGSDPLASAKIFGTREFLQKSAKKNYGHVNHYLMRAAAGHIGLYGNSAAEAIYPSYLADSDGRPFDASANRYTLTFEKGQLPPVKAFWSLTMYDGKTQLFINNSLDRYLLNSAMMDQFKLKEDGSLVLHIAKNPPRDDLKSNWLPAPDGPFYMVLRLYGPEAEALEGKWTPPVLQKVDAPIKVNVDNFVRAETASQIDRFLKTMGGGKINTWVHLRVPTPLDSQTVIRMNRDTLYSAALVDISKGATLTIPEAGDRYLSIMVVNEDHYINKVYHDAGTYELTMEEFHTPYVFLSARILVNSSDPADIKEVNILQDQITTKAVSAKPYTHPNYDSVSYKATYKPLIELSREVSGTKRMFGKKEEVGEVRHLLGTAFGFGGLPEHEAYYINMEPNLPVGAYQLTVKDVPVDAFWSVSLYNREGYFQENKHNAYSVNNISGTPNKDGSFTIHFGGDPESVNYLHILEGWNYTVRLYQPRKDILDETWIFPTIQTVK